MRLGLVTNKTGLDLALIYDPLHGAEGDGVQGNPPGPGGNTRGQYSVLS